MEIDIQPCNQYLLLDKSRLAFYVDIPERFVPENYFTAKLFEYCEVRLNHITINNKTSDNDYHLTTYFLTRINFDESTLKTTGSLDGYWSWRNYDSDTLLIQQSNAKESINSHFEVNLRRANVRDITIDSKRYKRYYFICRLNCGLAMTSRPIPKDVPIKLIFYRAEASKSLLSIIEDKANDEPFPTRTIPIQDPQFIACMTKSDYYDRKYASYRLPKLDFPFIQPSVRRELLNKGLDQFKIRISDGPLPIALGLAIMTTEGFTGDIRKSSTNFKMHNLDWLDIQINSRSVSGYPLHQRNQLGYEFYYKFLRECNFLDNHLSSGSMDLTSFQDCNFIVIENFKRKNLFNGQLTVNLKFTQVLTENLYLVLLPITQKKVNFDEHLNVTLSDMRPDDAEEAVNDFDEK